MTKVSRHFVDLPAGTIHYASCGSGPPVLLLHQTPRSWDEYRDVLPLLGRHFHAIAMDTLGYGDSAKPLPVRDSIELWAEVALDLADALGLERFAVVGHHTGAAIAIELAAAYPQSIRAAVLSAPPFVDAARRARAPSGIDDVTRRSDGSHLAELWRMRQPWYPAGDTDLLERYVIDAIKSGPRAAEGHAVVSRYGMETRLPLVRCPVLVIDPLADPHAHPQARRVADAIVGARLVEVEGGLVPLPDQMPERFAELVTNFLGA